MPKKVIIITISAAVGDSYTEFLYELYGDLIEVINYSMEKDVFREMEVADLYIVGTTSSDVFEYVMSLIPNKEKVVVSKITFTKAQLETLKRFPKGTRALLVNLSANMAIETIADLNRLGITNVKFQPAYPEMEIIPEFELAITPGEKRYVPRNVKEVVDLGSRVFSASVVVEIALKLGFSWFLKSEKCRQFIDSLAEQDYSIDALAMENMSMENKMEILINAMEPAIIGIDYEMRVFLCNPAAEKLIGIDKEEMLGRAVLDVIPELGRIIGTKRIDERFTRLIDVRDTIMSMNCIPIIYQEKPVGYYAILQKFQDEENRQQKLRLQLLERGHSTKYTFEDLIGTAPSMIKAKKIAMRMAQTDASILLTGESGTGKELFAHSIHNHSKRANMPFVAINCAALPETLLESELFGYGEGAFTGAKKGGKLGLFEHAHRGTLFLDEIEGMSPNLQIKLLRVLQEKEIMRVGENKTINVDVRIIAASNENIREMVKKGSFRKDLYYRINTLPIDIVPLRDRGDDIFLIMEKIMEEIGAHFTLSEAARCAFRSYIWDGNVRELRNIVEYLKFMDLEYIDFEDLPDALREQTQCIECSQVPMERDRFFEQIKSRRDYFLVVLKLLAKRPMGIGRKNLCEEAASEGYNISEQQARGILNVLAEFEYAVSAKGRGGSRLTKKGQELYDYMTLQEFK